MISTVKDELHDLMVLVREGRLSVDEADIHLKMIITETIGETEQLEGDSTPGFPERWNTKDLIAAKKTWVHARNHLRRGIYAKLGF